MPRYDSNLGIYQCADKHDKYGPYIKWNIFSQESGKICYCGHVEDMMLNKLSQSRKIKAEYPHLYVKATKFISQQKVEWQFPDPGNGEGCGTEGSTVIEWFMDGRVWLERRG